MLIKLADKSFQYREIFNGAFSSKFFLIKFYNKIMVLISIFLREDQSKFSRDLLNKYEYKPETSNILYEIRNMKKAITN